MCSIKHLNLKESYPETFSFEEFNNIQSFDKKLKYANQRLFKISSGSARVVYKVDNEKVIKIAKNKKGLAQNLIEADWGVQNHEIAAKIFNVGEFAMGIGPFWIEMEFAKKVTPSRFKQLTGFSKDEIHRYLLYLKYKNAPKNDLLYVLNDVLKSKAENSEFIQNLENLIFEFDMLYPGDFGKVSSYGEVLRYGKPKIVLVDFGLTKTVWNDFYKVNL